MTGETGEVWARGPQITDGYNGAPELTANQFRDGWLLTGDMGYLDETGALFLVGRSKDLIIYKGYNVYPQTLEQLICEFAVVAQAAVVPAPDDVAGEIPVAFVTLQPGVGGDEALAAKMMGHVAAHVAAPQKVRRIEFIDVLPVTMTGKVLKTELRKRLIDELV